MIPIYSLPPYVINEIKGYLGVSFYVAETVLSNLFQLDKVDYKDYNRMRVWWFKKK